MLYRKLEATCHDLTRKLEARPCQPPFQYIGRDFCTLLYNLGTSIHHFHSSYNCDAPYGLLSAITLDGMTKDGASGTLDVSMCTRLSNSL